VAATADELCRGIGGRKRCQYNGRDESRSSGMFVIRLKGKECSRCNSVIGTVRDPVRKAKGTFSEFGDFNAMLLFEKKNR
jgi:hypothetical protein